MRNVARIFLDDARRLVANAMSIVITIGLVVLPSLFAWYNILACWDVFENTGNLEVAVANADEGYESDLVPLRVNVGDRVVSALRGNDQIDWVFTDEADAVDGARAGRYYAAVVIPPSFSRDLLTFYADDAQRAAIVYYSNEKKNAIAPKVTDQSADAVSREVNETFAETVSEVALAFAESLSRSIDASGADSAVAAVPERMRSAADRLDDAAGLLDSYAALARTSGELAADSADLAASLRLSLDEAASAGSAGATSARDLADGLLGDVDGLFGSLEEVESGLDDLASSAGGAEGSPDGEGVPGDVQSLREEVAAQAAAASEGVAGIRSSIDEGVRGSLERVAEGATSLDEGIAAASASLADAGERIEAVASSASGALDAMEGRLANAAGEARAGSERLRSLADEVDGALASGDSGRVREILGADAQTLSQAIAAPVGVSRVAVYPVENFGSAMTPLYTALALFIGSLLIMVAVKPSVSEGGLARLEDPKPSELFAARFGAVGLLSLLQATVMGLGCLLFLQVQVAHPLLFMVCFWVAGLVFSFIVYTLVSVLANAGKALAVLLLIAQVTGCGGSYPLAILPPFVQSISPYLPATHVVDALRAAMMGVYGNDFWASIGCLAAFLVPAALLGLVFRRPIARLTHRFVEQAESSRLIG